TRSKRDWIQTCALPILRGVRAVLTVDGIQPRRERPQVGGMPGRALGGEARLDQVRRGVVALPRDGHTRLGPAIAVGYLAHRLSARGGPPEVRERGSGAGAQ